MDNGKPYNGVQNAEMLITGDTTPSNHHKQVFYEFFAKYFEDHTRYASRARERIMVVECVVIYIHK